MTLESEEGPLGVSWSESLLFVHVSLAVIWVGGGLMMQFFALRATMSGDPSRIALLGFARGG